MGDNNLLAKSTLRSTPHQAYKQIMTFDSSRLRDHCSNMNQSTTFRMQATAMATLIVLCNRLGLCACACHLAGDLQVQYYGAVLNNAGSFESSRHQALVNN
jgi:hypothetical protein